MSILRVKDQAEFDALQARQRSGKVSGHQPAPEVAPTGLQSKRRGMNKTEERFAEYLRTFERTGELHWWAFEPLRFRLADGAWFKPDFVSIDGVDWRFDVWEVKGHMREAANVRLKVAAELYPWARWHLVKWVEGRWQTTRIGE